MLTLIPRRLPPALLAGALALALLPAAASAITAGAPADRAAYPSYTVVGGSTHCGGTLIAPDRVLTAAHCEETVQLNRTVWVGPADEQRTVTKIAAHPQYVKYSRGPGGGNFGLQPADLLILQLDRPVTDIAPLPIATAADGLTAPGQPATIIGRGIPVDGQEPRDMIFRSATMVVVPDASCGSVIGGAFQRSWSLCALDPRAVADPKGAKPFMGTCHGDSGGPLLATKDGVTYTLGTVSGSEECGGTTGDVFGDAVRGRSFALDPTPPWEPYAAGRPALRGTPRPGHTLRCVAPWTVRPTSTVTYFAMAGGAQGPYDELRNAYRVRPRDRGKRLTCSVNGFTAGGNFVTRSAPAVRILR